MRAPPLAPLLLLAGAVAMVAGVAGGLVRLGFAIPVGAAPATVHGALMVHGVFGTLVATERAVALGRGPAFLAPVLSASGALLSLASPAHFAVSAALYLGAALALAAASIAIVRVQNATFTKLLALGTLPLAAAAAGLLLGATPGVLAPAWMAFLVITIAGERVELSRMVRPPAAMTRALTIALVLTAGAATAAIVAPLFARVFGALLVVAAGLLVRLDVARRTVRLAGLPRFVAIALFAGFAWLALGGVILAASDLVPGRASYDAGLHAIFVGFVLSMVFAHAPIVLPAVAGVRIPFDPLLYAPLTLLHASLALRVIGDAAEVFAWRRAGGLGHALAIAAFVLVVVITRVRAHRAEVRHAH